MADLRSDGEQQAAALEELRSILLRGSLYTFNRYLADFQNLAGTEVLKLAEDCAQDALLAILARLDEFRGDSRFTTWAYKFAINIALTTSRRERWKEASLEELSADGDLPVGLNTSVPAGENPSQSALQNEIWSVIQEIIQEDLTPRQRQVIVLMVLNEVPMDVVVERLHTNRNAVYKLLHDARLKLKQGLADRGFEVIEALSLFQA